MKKSVSLHMWGTSTKGSIPISEGLETGSGGLLNRNRGTAIDHPMEVDVLKALNVGKRILTITVMILFQISCK